MWKLEFYEFPENGDFTMCVSLLDKEKTGWTVCEKNKQFCIEELLGMVERDALRNIYTNEEICGAVMEIDKWLMQQLKN